MSTAAPHRRALEWWRLLRAANVFTAASNVLAGYLIVRGAWTPAGPLLALVAASVLIYLAGMALNDAFDAEVDAVERPERPIPAGQISRTTAFGVGWALLAGGVAWAALAAWQDGAFGPIVAAGCLAATVVMYNGGLKNTWAGPYAMGWCRTLNVILGGSLVGTGAAWLALGLYATAVGLYTVGLTMTASREAGTHSAGRPRAAEYVIAASCALLFGWPWVLLGSRLEGSALAGTVGFFAFALLAMHAAQSAARSTEPAVIRTSVKRLILGFILIDACAAATAAGVAAGAAVLMLMIPAAALARWAPMT